MANTTFFVKFIKNNILIVKVYVVDIIFGVIFQDDMGRVQNELHESVKLFSQISNKIIKEKKSHKPSQICKKANEEVKLR